MRYKRRMSISYKDKLEKFMFFLSRKRLQDHTMHAIELEWIQWIQQFRSPFFDYLFLSLRIFDAPQFFLALPPILWLNYGWKNGLKTFYIVFFCAISNYLLKDIFLSPRPCTLIPELGFSQIEGYGFPSGAAQMTMLLSGLFVYFQKSPKKWAIAIPYFLLVSFSRIYLGVHFFSDIIAGWVFGFILLLGVIYFLPRIEKSLKHKNIYKLLSLHLFVVIVIALTTPLNLGAPYMGFAIGFAIGLWLCHKFKITLPTYQGVNEFLIRTFIGVGGLFFINFFIPIPTFFNTIISGFWISFIALYFLRNKIFLKGK